MGFEGFVISDWNAIEEIPDATLEEQVWISINAGLDMIMQPEKWKQVHAALIKGAQEGKVSEERINDAVTRILKVKFESGLFEDPLLLLNENKADSLRSKNAREIATKLAEETLVLLKNDNNTLPLKEGTKIFIAGEGADNIGLQCGGWSIEWQGKVDSLSEITEGVTILEGLQNLKSNKNIELITDRARADEADVVLMVLSEIPYAEMQGDSEDLSLTGAKAHEENSEIIEFVKTLQKPVVNEWESIAMAYLPGSEGGQAIANVLLGESNFSGKLPMPWYQSTDDIKKDDVDLLYPVGYGLSY